MRLLIVDDELLIRNVIKEYALDSGYEVAEAEDGLDALRKIEEQKFDLVILDVMMPNMDGFRTCTEIKKNHNIPVIILSARTDEIDKLLGFDLGIDDYLTKPFSPKELMARIKAILKRHQKSDEFIYETLKIDRSEERRVGKEC